MKYLFAKCLSALLIATLLLSPVALMEESDIAPTVASEEAAPDAVAEPIGETEEASADTDGEDADNADDEETVEPETEIVVEAVDESVAEAGDVDLSTLEAQSDELYTDALEDFAAESANASAMLLGAGGDVDINSSFPDSAFREYVRGFDTSKDGKLSLDERSKVKEIEVSQKGITGLTGIKLFPNLTTLNCNWNRLTTLNVSGCSNLTKLDCSYNELTTLNVSDCSNLDDLYCGYNQLTTLNVSGCSNLTKLNSYGNPLTTLNVSGCLNLTELRCSHNDLTTLNVSGYSNLTELDCGFNQLTTLNVSGCSNLYNLYCGYNQLTTLNVTGCINLVYLGCEYNSLSELNLMSNTKLEYLSCYKNPNIKILDISNCQILNSTVDPNAPKEIKCEDIDGDYYIEGYGPYIYGPYIDEDAREDYRLECDKGVTIITKKTDSPAPAPAPAQPATISAVKKNSKATLKAVPGTVYQLDLGGASGKKFKSSKKKVATVDKSGNVTIKGAGKTVISFKVGKKTRKVKLTVKDPTIPTSVTLVPATTAVKKGDTVTLMPVVPDNTNPGGFKWKSSNKKVATVKNGVVKFKKKGRVTITCTAKRGKKKAKVKFTVSP